jgi:TRIAD3 protein (E3 ubiquitin-protein ligase RNF216)
LDGRYAPTYISLAEQEEQYEVGKHSKRPVKLPYKRRKIAFRPINNGKKKALYDEEFEKECAWVVREVMDDDDECEGGIECGCCFASYRFVRVTALSAFANLIYQAAKYGSVSRSTFVLPNLHEILCC